MPRTEEILLRIIGDSASGEKALKRIEQAVEPLKKRFDQLSQGAKYVGAAFAGLAAAGGTLIKSTAQVALRNEVLGVSLYTVGEMSGYSRQELDTLEAQVKDLGITTSQTRSSLMRMMQSQLDLSQATDLARASQNLAVIAGENSSQTYGNIMDSVSALQPRLLRQYGIVSTVDQILGDLSQSTDTAAKRQRFLTFVLDEAAKVGNVYENAMGVVGKQLTSFPRYIEEAKAAFGKHFIPTIGKAAEILKVLIQGFESLPDPVQRFLAMGVLLGTVLSAVGAALAGVVAAIPFLISGFTAVSGALAPILPILLAIGAALAVVGGAGYVLVKAWKEDWGGIRTAVQEAWASIQPALSELMQLFREIGALFGLAGNQIGGVVHGVLVPAFAGLAALIRAVPWAEMVTHLKDAINVAVTVVSSFIQTIRAIFSGDGERAFMALHEAMLNVLTMIALTWDRYISDALAWGYNLVVEAANGIIKAAQSVMTAAMNYLGNLIGGFLAGRSPPAEGPLSHLVEWGQGVFETYLQAFSLADFGILEEALAPVEAALEDALTLGDIDETEFVNIYGTVRDQVAQLIAVFEETGQVSQDILGDISDSLGAGGDDIVEYIELQLGYQEALNNLLAVEEEVAAAEAAGFIPADLKAKLEGAEAEADAAYDQMRWQEEYLAMAQDTVDLELRMVEVLEDLAETLADVAEETEGVGAGEIALEPTLAGGLDLDLGDTASLDGVTTQLGVMSSEFLAMKERVRGVIDSITDFIELPLDEKLSKIAGWLSETTGIDFEAFWAGIQEVLADIDERGLLAVLAEWVRIGLEYVDENWKDWAKTIGGTLGNILLWAGGLLLEQIETHGLVLIAWLGEVILALLAWAEEKRQEWGTTIFTHMVAAMARLVELLVTDIPKWIGKLVAWLGDVVQGLLDWFKDEAPRYGQQLWNNFLIALNEWLTKMYENLKDWVANLVQWFSDLLAGFGEELLAQADTLLQFLYDFGALMVDRIKEGLDDHWWMMLEWLKKLLQDLKDWFPFSEPKNPRSPLSDFAASGRALAENFAMGIDFSSAETALQVGLGQLRGTMQTGLGAVSVQQSFEGGLNFPNVKSGRDALSVRRGLDRRAYEAALMGRTGGL